MRVRMLTAVVASIAALGAPLLVTSPAAAAVATPAAAVTLPVAIEDMPSYQPQSFCDPVNKPGPVAFGALLTTTYPDTSVVDISRSCTSESGTSEHKDGRALDWGANYKNAQQVKEVNAVFAWLFATDAAGNKYAMLRRLGIMYIIWNKRIWGTWSQSWQPYSCSGVTACHQDHVHFSFDWAGAKKRTSFWTGTVGAPVPVPNYVYANAKFAQVLSVGARSKGVTTPFSVRAGVSYRFTVTGTYHSSKTAMADAECNSSDSRSWKALAAGDATSGTGLLDLWVGTHRSWRPTVATGGGCNATGHSYSRTLTFPTTGPLRLSIDDATRGDDSGSLKVTVQRI